MKITKTTNEPVKSDSDRITLLEKQVISLQLVILELAQHVDLNDEDLGEVFEELGWNDEGGEGGGKDSTA